MILLHANDMLDHQILQNGNFSPTYSAGSVNAAIFEIVDMVRHTVERKKLNIQYNLKDIESQTVLSFDRRRMQ